MRRALLLHGFSGDSSGFAAVCRALGTEWECVCPELPGHGPSPGALMARSFEEGIADFATSLCAVLGEACCDVHLLGYSLGARTALGLLDHCPGYFASAALVGVHPGLAGERERRARAESDQHWIRLLRRGGVEAFCEDWEAQPLFASQRALPHDAFEHQRTRRRRHTADGLAWSLETFGLAAMPSYWGLLREPLVPTHVIFGELDGKFRALAERVTSQARNIELTIIPGSGHNPVLEQPSALARAFVEGIAHD